MHVGTCRQRPEVVAALERRYQAARAAVVRHRGKLPGDPGVIVFTEFEVGERSLSFEAYVLPAPLQKPEVHRQVLVRNQRAWRVFFAVDREEAIVLRGRLPRAQVTLEELDLVLGEIYETIEISFRPLVTAGFSRS